MTCIEFISPQSAVYTLPAREREREMGKFVYKNTQYKEQDIQNLITATKIILYDSMDKTEKKQ